MNVHPILIGGSWVESKAIGRFHATDPVRGQPLGEMYPISSWHDVTAALDAARAAAEELGATSPERLADFLEEYAAAIEARAAEIVQAAQLETGLPASPRLADVELPRTVNQLRQAASAAREGSWCRATIDTKHNIRSYYAALGPVCVMGPNNFPLAFNSVAGGDFAAAIAAGCPVIAKAHSAHPTTTRLLGELAHQAVERCELPPATVQLLYRLDHADGMRLVGDPRLGATAYTGSRAAGLQLKAAADACGKPIYLELSSINPVVILPGALRQRRAQVVDEYVASALLGTGQFCTNPGLVLLLQGDETEQFLKEVAERFDAAPAGTLLTQGVAQALQRSIETLLDAGAVRLTSGTARGNGYSCPNTLLRVDGGQFLRHWRELQTEAFGNAALAVVAQSAEELLQVVDCLEGNLTGTLYTDTQGGDDELYQQIEPHLRVRVGRLLNDKMPTGVAVSPAMVHGGPYPATGHPGFTAVGIPASMTRFAMLQCYDNVREHRLPLALRNKNPNGRMWRYIDGAWTQGDVA
jgi:NADP-dependent aldehyde dehydrogenase